MKNLTIVGVLMLGIGFAIGWLAKPVPSALIPVAVTAAPTSSKSLIAGASSNPADAPVQGKRAQRNASAPKPSNMPTPGQMEEANKMQAEMSKAMVKRLRSQFENQIDRLTENLHLTPQQKAGLVAYLDERMKKMESLDFTDPKTMADIPETGKLLSNKALEDQLAPTLTDDQKTALADFKDREHRGKVDTMALKNLSKLQGIIEFEDGQRDKVYDILTQGAEAGILRDEEKPDMTSMFTEGMGIEMDPYDLGLQQAMSDAALSGIKSGGAPEAGGQKQMLNNMKSVIDKRIDGKVEALRPVLNDKQLEQYRSELKSKGAGIFGSMFMGSSEETIVIPNSSN